MDQIVLKNVMKSYTTKTLGTVVAVRDFNLNVKEGECFSILGPSGCGKSTTLRMIAGFEDLTEGEIWLGDKLVSSSKKNIYIPPEDRGLGMVFQAFAVWPHMNIYKNVAFPLEVQRRPKAEIRERVAKALKHCSLDGMAGLISGIVISVSDCTRLAPHIRLASSREEWTCCSDAEQAFSV